MLDKLYDDSIDYLELKDAWVIDIETDDLLATKIHLIVVQHLEKDDALVFTCMDDFTSWYDSVRDDRLTFIGHNAISFDIPTINRLLGLEIPLNRVCDTLVLSRLYDPNMEGGHSLESWGERFRFPKIQFNDWSKLTPEMVEYCKQDVNLTKMLYKRLTRRMVERGFSNLSAWIEHMARIVIDDQQQNGWYFDIQYALDLQQEIESKLEALQEEIHALFPPVLEKIGDFKRARVADGSLSSLYLKHLGKYPVVQENADGGFSSFDYKEFNIGSPKQRVEKLLGLGWVPEKFTEKGFPQVDEDSLLDFANKSGIKEVEAIAKWIVLRGRLNMITTWINSVDKSDQRIHGKVNSCGASTRRMTHSSPNTANIPKAKAKVVYGVESRRCWSTPPGKVNVGYDAKGLEMRMFAHYLNDPEAAKLYIEGDPHQVNADTLSIDRDPVKNVFYAFLYGAQDAKLGWTGNTSLVSKREQQAYGKWIRETLEASTPGLKQLVSRVKKEQKTGFIRCIDGGYVRCPSPHAALNYLLQSAGAIVMKCAAIYIFYATKGMSNKKIGDIHDEGQHECDPGQAHQIGEICVESIREAGRFLKFSVPLDGEYKIGKNWAETH